MYVSASRTGMGVALKAPVVVRRQLLCITESLLVDVFDEALVIESRKERI